MISINWTMLVQIINFIILLVLLRIFLYKPVTKMLDARTNQIKESIALIEEKESAVNSLKQEYDDRIKKSRQEGQELIARASKRGEAAREEIVRKAREEAQEILERAQVEIDREREKILLELRGEIAGLAVAAAGKVVQQALSVEDHQKLIDDFLAEVGEISC